MTGLLLAALLALTPPQEPLSGSSDPKTEADFRCFAASLVMAGLAGEDDPEAVNAAALVSFYYLGRLEGRAPSVDWIARGIKVGNANPELLIAELTRCGAEFAAKGEEMVAKGESDAS